MRGWLFGLLGLWVCATASAASKAPSLTAIQKELAQGNFEQAAKDSAKALKTARAAQEIASLQLLRGEALVALGKNDEAKEAFVEALRRDALVELDPAVANPQMQDVLDAARQEVKGQMAVEVVGGDGAQIRLDGKPLGPAPLKVLVPVGRHKVSAELGDRRATQEVVVETKGTATVSLELPTAKVAEPEHPATSQGHTEASNTPPAEKHPEGGEVRHEEKGTGPGVLPWVPVGLGAVAVGVGALFASKANGPYNELTKKDGLPLSQTDEATLVKEGEQDQLIARIAIGVGVAAMAGGVVWLLAGHGDGGEPSAAVVPTGAGAAVVATF